MKKAFIVLLILVVIAAVTNPDETKHREAAKKELFGVGEDKKEIKGLNLGNFLVNNAIMRKNRYVYSETILSVMGEEKVIGYGFLGFVFINKEKLEMNN